MTAKAELPSLAEVRDILDNARRFAHLIEMAAKSLGAGHDENAYDAISMGTNAIIDEIEKASSSSRKARRHDPPLAHPPSLAHDKDAAAYLAA
jgi:hypothetical protein